MIQQKASKQERRQVIDCERQLQPAFSRRPPLPRRHTRVVDENVETVELLKKRRRYFTHLLLGAKVCQKERNRVVAAALLDLVERLRTTGFAPANPAQPTRPFPPS